MQVAEKRTAAPSENGHEMVFQIIDISGSMDEEDYYPSRLEGAKKAGERFIDVKLTRFPDDEVGIISFGDNAKLVHPLIKLRTGHDSLKKALRSIVTDGCTNMTSGLKLAEQKLASSSLNGLLPTGKFFSALSNLLYGIPGEGNPKGLGNKRAIILTDGHYNAGGSPRSTARKMAEAGIVIECIGIGGSPSDVDEKTLKAIASTDEAGKPRYWFISDTEELIKKYEQLGGWIKAS